jgi:hypothetical protein
MTEMRYVVVATDKDGTLHVYGMAKCCGNSACPYEDKVLAKRHLELHPVAGAVIRPLEGLD